MSKTKKIRRGVRVLDVVTGVKGIVVAKTKHITGCDSIAIQPMSNDGSKVETHFVDVPRCKYIDEGIRKKAKRMREEAEASTKQPSVDLPGEGKEPGGDLEIARRSVER